MSILCNGQNCGLKASCQRYLDLSAQTGKDGKVFIEPPFAEPFKCMLYKKRLNAKS